MSNDKKKSNRKGRKSQSDGQVAWVVPPLDVSCILKKNHARWEVKSTIPAASPTSILASSLIVCLNVVATLGTVVNSVFWCIRIRKIILYSPAVVSSGTSAMAFEWKTPSGLTFGTKPNNVVSGSTGTGQGAKQVMRPPAKSIWENWITLTSPGDQAVFTIALPAGTTIDLEYDAYCDNADGTVTRTVSGAVVGNNYRMGLDTNPIASTNFIPLGYASI